MEKKEREERARRVIRDVADTARREGQGVYALVKCISQKGGRWLQWSIDGRITTRKECEELVADELA